MPSLTRTPLLSIAAALLVGCGGAQAVPGAAGEGRFVDPSTGATLSFDDALARLEGARVVYLGERHDRPEDHAMQARIARALAAERPIVLGLEMVQRPYQDALSRYAAGDIDEAAMLEGVEWSTRWGFEYAMYRPLSSMGPEGLAELVALNAPREVTRAIARGGLGSLDEDARAQLPELVLDDPAHRAVIREAFVHHPHMDDAMFERFYTAQVVWDETMAATVAEAAEAGGTVVVIAGTMHVLESAIPARAARRGAGPHAIVQPIDEAELRDPPPGATVLFVTP